MAKLDMTLNGAFIREFTLERERVHIGRGPDNDLTLEDPTVSGRHAAIRRTPSAYMEGMYEAYLEDLGSTNGTLVNGRKIKRHLLKHGDVIAIGRHQFKYNDERTPNLDRTAIILPE